MQRERTRTMRIHLFDSMHPVVLLAYFGVILVFSMIALHPVYLALSFSGAFLLSGYLRGWSTSFKMLAWQFPLVILIALINPVFSSIGSTELFYIGSKVVHAEELIFGGCMGLMLVSVMLWFMNLAYVMSSDKIMGLCGGKAPTLNFMFSAVMRQIPQFLRRGKEVDQSTKACTAAAGHTRANAFASRVRLTSVLMAWSMEDSIEMADAMKARGWGSSPKRSSYKRHRFKRRDACVLIALTLVAAISVILAWPELAAFQFYPQMKAIVFQPAYVTFGMLVVAPLLLALIDLLRWR